MTFKRLSKEAHIGERGLKELQASNAIIIGAGSLGSRVSQLLGSLGIGTVTLIDRDIVTDDNLAQQPLYRASDLGLPKATRAAAILSDHFPATTWIARDIELDSRTISELKNGVIIDCTDNLLARYLLNEHCVKNGIAWVHGSAIGSDGEACAFLPDGACFRCLLPEGKAVETCESVGILPTTASLVASLQGTLLTRILLGERPDGMLHRVRGWEGSVLQISFSKRGDCPVCVQKKFELLSQEPEQTIQLCGGGVFQTRISAQAARGLFAHAEKSWPGGALIGPLRIFEDGRVLIVAKTEGEAKSIVSRFIAK